VNPVIIMRECIATVGTYGTRFPKGLIMSWPADMKLPTGMVWLREEVLTAGPEGTVVPSWGDFTAEAKKIMQEVAEA
jgi:hypothetical protein